MILLAMPPRLMTSALLAALLGACQPSTTYQTTEGPAHADSAAIRRDIAFLSSDLLEGRGTGTKGNDSAAVYIARRYATLGLRPLGRSGAGQCPQSGSVRLADSACVEGYLQRFSARSIAAAHAGRPSSLPTQNVIAIIPGTDPRLRQQYVVIGAHFDHLGRSPDNAIDRDLGDVIRNGADDNASGTAAVLELARLLSRSPTKRSIILANFSGEELGLFGSQFMVDNSPVPLDSVTAMLNFDMVGRLRGDTLIVYGVSTATDMMETVQRANVAPPLVIRPVGDGAGPSDQTSFYLKGIPVLHFFTNTHEDYHRASDDIERINAGGEARVVDFAERIVRDIGNRDARLAFERAPVTASRMPSRSSSGVWFGSVPDMASGDEKGMRLSGVTPGGPADKAGLKAGDLVVEFGGKTIGDLYDYTDALNGFKPGDSVEVVVVRKGERLKLTAVLGKRGG
jgi:hypothetical protein